MKLFRGMAVSEEKADCIIENIKKKGMQAGDGHRTIIAPDLKEEFQDRSKWKDLISDRELSADLTRRKEAETICACADNESALFYACVHNRTKENTKPLLIEFEAAIKDIWVDGRDFLYTVFGLWDSKTSSEGQKNKVKKVLLETFGEGILIYLKKAFETPRDNYRRRLALVDLAINDHKVIEVHSENRIWIHGRYGTFFKSAFLVRSLVPSTQVILSQACEASFVYPTDYLELSEILGS